MKLALNPLLLGATPDLPVFGQEPQVLAGLAVIVVMAAVLIAIAKTVDFRRQRADQVVALDAQIRSALIEDPAFIDSAVAPTVHIPFWRGSPARIVMRGPVPSPYLEERALRLAAAAAARMRPDYIIENGLTVAPSSTSRDAASPSGPERGEVADRRPRRRGERLVESGAAR